MDEIPNKRKPGAQPGNINSLKHGFYSRRFLLGEASDLDTISGRSDLHDEINMMRVVIRRVFEQASDEAADLESWSKALGTLGAAASRLAILLRVQGRLADRSSEVASALSEALDQVVKDLAQ